MGLSSLLIIRLDFYIKTWHSTALKTQNKHLRETELCGDPWGKSYSGPTLSTPVWAVANTAVIIAVACVRSVWPECVCLIRLLLCIWVGDSWIPKGGVWICKIHWWVLHLIGYEALQHTQTHTCYQQWSTWLLQPSEDLFLLIWKNKNRIENLFKLLKLFKS